VIEPRALPKAELHVHIEGTFEPAQIFEFAKRNDVKLSYSDVAALEEAYKFTDLQSFLNLYYAAMAAIRTERDFEELATAYLRRAQAQGVRHAEIFFDPQAHLERGLSFDTIVGGLWSALQKSEADFGMTTALIMCFLRDQSAESAAATLELAIPHRDKIIAVGLDSAELGNPPSKFKTVFDRARVGRERDGEDRQQRQRERHAAREAVGRPPPARDRRQGRRAHPAIPTGTLRWPAVSARLT